MTRRDVGTVMICLGQGTVNWEAWSAFGTIFAALVALGASWLALRAPEWAKQSDRYEATREVLRAAADSIAIYRSAAELVAKNTWPDEQATAFRIRADHQHQTLERLIRRPSLTDGGVAVGAGAMSIAAAIRNIPTARETRNAVLARSGGGGGARFVDTVEPARMALQAAASVVEVVEHRAGAVRKYADRSGRRGFLLPRRASSRKS